MPPRDEVLSFIQRSIASSRQLTYGEAKKLLLITKQMLWEAEQEAQRLDQKFFDQCRKGSTSYPEYSADRAQRAVVGDRIYYLTQLVDIFQLTMESREEDAGLLARELAKALRQIPGPSSAQLKTNTKKKTKAVKPPRQRDVLIYSVIQKGLKERRYVTALDRAGVQIPESWKEKDCPSTYLKAYDADERWRTLIRREKYRIRKRMEGPQTSL